MIGTLTCAKLYPDAKLPAVASPVCVDVYAYLKSERGHDIKILVPPGMARIIPTGITAIPEDPYSIVLCPHVMLAMNGVHVLNTLTSTNPRELVVLLHNAGTEPQWIEHGNAIAQAILVQLPTPLILESSHGRDDLQMRR